MNQQTIEAGDLVKITIDDGVIGQTVAVTLVSPKGSKDKEAEITSVNTAVIDINEDDVKELGSNIDVVPKVEPKDIDFEKPIVDFVRKHSGADKLAQYLNESVNEQFQVITRDNGILNAAIRSHAESTAKSLKRSSDNFAKSLKKVEQGAKNTKESIESKIQDLANANTELEQKLKERQKNDHRITNDRIRSVENDVKGIDEDLQGYIDDVKNTQNGIEQNHKAIAKIGDQLPGIKDEFAKQIKATEKKIPKSYGGGLVKTPATKITLDTKNFGNNLNSATTNVQKLADAVDDLTDAIGLLNIVEDTTPQLGGDLDTNGSNIDVNGGKLTFTGADVALAATDTGISENSADLLLQGADNMFFNIDSNNGSTGRYFRWQTDGVAGSGTTLMHLDDSGNLGIGTTSPGNELSIDDGGGASGTPLIDFNDSRAYVGYDGSSAILGGGSGKNVSLEINGA